MKNKIIISSILTIAMCLSMIAGSTFALFTSEDSVNIAVTSGKLEVTATIEETLELSSLGVAQSGKFANGGTATLENGTLTLKNMTPGDSVKLSIKVENKSNVAMQYRFVWAVEGKLAEVLVATANQKPIVNEATTWQAWNTENGMIQSFAVVVTLPETVGNLYQNAAANISFKVEAIQGNAPIVDEWDGTVDTAWFDADEYEATTTYTLSTAEELAGLAALIDGSTSLVDDEGNAVPVTFEGKEIKLDSDVDLYMEDENGEPICFDPIGSYRNEQVFTGTFDGQGHTISNLNQNTWELNNGYYYNDLGLGLFACVEDATIKNLVMENASLSGESAIVGIVAATAYGDCVFENITVKNSRGADYQYYAGGIVGWASGNHQYTNCTIDETTTIAAQWGDFDNSTGGIIGGCGGSSQILLKDCTVACRIDSYNDVTSSYQWYAYRRAGMLIGNTGKTETIDGSTVAAAPQLTCENVTVIYGEWADYHYCEFAGTSWPYVRVEAGVSNSAYSNPRYGHPTDANGNTVVDDNHVHNDGEDHMILCVFDQLYGGGQGVYGNPAHAGVTVIYNNPSKQ